MTRSGWHVAKDTSCHLQICRFGEFLNTHARTGTATAEESQEFEAQNVNISATNTATPADLKFLGRQHLKPLVMLGSTMKPWLGAFELKGLTRDSSQRQRRCPSKTMCSWGRCDLKPPLGNWSACFAEAGTINKPRVQFRHQLHHRIQRTPLRNAWKSVACTSCLVRVISY